MSRKFTLLLVLFTSSVLFFSGWGDKANLNLITNYYYYKNQPFYLNLKPDAVYVNFVKNVAEERFRAIISEFNQIYSLSDFNEDDTKYFLQLNAVLDESAIVSLVQNLKSRPEIEYCSPAFSPDGGTTLIGVEDEILVQFKPTIPSADVNNYLQSKNLTIIKSLDLTGGTSYLLKVSKQDFAVDIANEMYLSGIVNWAEPNLLFTNLICYIPNDTFFTMQWALRNTGNNIPGGITGIVDCDMDLDSAWDLTLGNNAVKIAISDTGVDTLHEDLAANMVVGSGWDFWNNDPWAWDDHNHGTACAGIVAALGNNVIGVSGVAPNCKLIPVKWLSATGNGNYAGATSATIWSYQKGAWVISNSWGFFGGASSSLDQAINDAATLGRSGKGTLFVVASGNENGPMRYPANTHPRVLVVGGISPCNQRKSPSSCDLESWGASYGSNLDIVAPCVKIYTTDRTGSVGYSSGNYYPFFNGTSSATPNTAGVCALVFSIDSSLTWDSVRVRIDRTAEKVGNYVYNLPGPRNIGGWNLEMGYGKVNAYNVVLYTQQHMGGSSGQLLTICRNGINKPIPDLGIVYDTIPVSLGSTNLVVDVNVKIDTVIHTWDNDLVFRLTRGSITRTLINQAGGSGDNFIGTVLNDSASCVIGSSGCNVPPFTGSFRPFQPLTAFNGLNPTGNWILTIRDTAAADSGLLKAWCLMITYVNTTGGISTITIPNKYSLKQNYPNPFNPVTKISYNLPKAGNVKLIIFDILGREVETLVNEYKQAGVYIIEFNAKNYSSGVYFYKIESGDFTDTKKMLMIK